MSDPKDTQAPEDLPVEGTTIDGSHPAPAPAAATDGGKPKGSNLQDLVDEPAKVMRIGTMIRQLLEEVKSAPLDDAGKVTATLSGFPTAGTIPVTEKYLGDTANLASTSDPVNLVVSAPGAPAPKVKSRLDVDAPKVIKKGKKEVCAVFGQTEAMWNLTMPAAFYALCIGALSARMLERERKESPDARD